MAFRRERELAGPVSRFLRNRTFDRQLLEVGFYELRMDLYGYSQREGLTVAVELKLSKWPKAVAQALLYQLCSDLVYIAMPTAAASRVDRAVLEAHGIGLIAVGQGRCRELHPARSSEVLRQRYRDDYLSLLSKESRNAPAIA